MEHLIKSDADQLFESAVIEFMKIHKHLTVRQCISLYVKKIKD
jgi:hypothetical protein